MKRTSPDYENDSLTEKKITLSTVLKQKNKMADDDSAFKPPPKRGRRQAVAAESYDPTADVEGDNTMVFYEKTDEQLKCLQNAATDILFFKKCDKEQQKVLFNAMFEKKVKAGDVIIQQGDDGDNFYVIEKGEYDVLVKDQTGKQNKVASLTEGFFGELALLYNCPRNATIISTTEGVCWGLDQKTFREVVVKATARKRAVFEELLKGVAMLESLTTHELTNLTDALDEKEFKQDELIIREGDAATHMYFIMHGEVLVKAKERKNSRVEKNIVELKRGEYFGELALVLKQPRVASVYASTETVKCALLEIHAFERLLGPCVEIMKRNIRQYEEQRHRLGIHSINDEEKNNDLVKELSNVNIK